MNKGKVHLIPNLLSDVGTDHSIPAGLTPIIRKLKYFMVENEKVSRRFLKKLDRTIDIDQLTFFSMGKHSEIRSISDAIHVIHQGHDLGVISDAGCPGIADPGSGLVSIAQQEGIEVIPYVGPSSILLTLMASGLNGQHFTFHGYLPTDKAERANCLRSIFQSISREGSTHLFMDTPFRNISLFEDVLKNSPSRYRLCIARDITGEREWIKTRSIEDWKKKTPDINKIPVMFALGQ